MSQTEAINAAIRLLNEGYAKGLVDEATYIRDDGRLRARQAEIRIYRNRQIAGPHLLKIKMPAPPPHKIGGSADFPAPPRLPLARPRRPLGDRITLRRRVAASGMLPHQLAGHFTLGEQAVMTAIAYEVMRHGACALPWAHLGDRAGCSRDLVRRTVHKAHGLGLVFLEERPRQAYGWKHAPTIVRILDGLWLRWLAKRKAAEERNQAAISARFPGGRNVPTPDNGKIQEGRFAIKERPLSNLESQFSGIPECRRAAGGPGG